MKWLKDIIDNCKLSEEQKLHPIFAIQANDPSIEGYVSSFRSPTVKSHLFTNWDKKREHFIKVSIFTEKLKLYNFKLSSF